MYCTHSTFFIVEVVWSHICIDEQLQKTEQLENSGRAIDQSDVNIYLCTEAKEQSKILCCLLIDVFLNINSGAKKTILSPKNWTFCPPIAHHDQARILWPVRTRKSGLPEKPKWPWNCQFERDIQNSESSVQKKFGGPKRELQRLATKPWKTIRYNS